MIARKPKRPRPKGPQTETARPKRLRPNRPDWKVAYPNNIYLPILKYAEVNDFEYCYSEVRKKRNVASLQIWVFQLSCKVTAA